MTASELTLKKSRNEKIQNAVANTAANNELKNQASNSLNANW